MTRAFPEKQSVHSHRQALAGRIFRPVLCCMLAGTVLLPTGCSRPFWRQQAELDTYQLLAEKLTDQRWIVPRLNVQPDVRSRFYNPHDIDFEPLPPDDPAAHELMHEVAGFSGYKSWHEFGVAFSIENPQWLDAFGLQREEFQPTAAPKPGLAGLALDQAVELAMIHNRDYQTIVEDAFLAALQLTLQRFQFDARYLGIGGGRPSGSLVHTANPGDPDSVGMAAAAGVSQLLPAGGQWAVELANNTLWLFSGSNQTSTSSLLSYSLVQPLFQGAGRKVVLANLTQQERNVLYTLRDLARFRKEFFTEISSSYLGLMLQLQAVANQRGNNERLEEQAEIQRALAGQRPEVISENLPNLPPNFEIPADLAAQLTYNAERGLLSWRGPMNDAQEAELRQVSNDAAYQAAIGDIVQRVRGEVITLSVAQLETQLAGARNTLRNAERSFQDALDAYKLQLGLPTDMPISLDTSLLKAFELIDPRLQGVEQEVKDFVARTALLTSADNAADVEPPPLAIDLLREIADDLQRLLQNVRTNGTELVEADLVQVKRILNDEPISDEPISDPSGEKSKRFANPEDYERTVRDVARDERLYAGLKETLLELESDLKETKELLSSGQAQKIRENDTVQKIKNAREQLLKISQGLQVIQIGLRVELITLEPFEIGYDEAVQTALDNRLDLMNRRAQVMDARRFVEVQANQLESVLDIRVEGGLGTSGDNRPFDFRGDNSSFRTGLEFTAPVNQIAQRNAYRQALVQYQRARREYMDYEDRIKLEVRQSWRQITVQRRNFENNRVSVRLAALQYDSAVEQAFGPAQQGQQNNALNLLNALNSVLAAQNSLIASWVSYEQSRLSIYRDMGTMEIDTAGLWVDPYYQQLASERRHVESTRSDGIDRDSQQPQQSE